MFGTTHAAMGVYIFLMFERLVSLESKTVLLGVAVIGSLLPDIDYAGSIIGKRAKIVGEFFRHRGFIHTVYVLFLFSLLVHSILSSWAYTVAFALAYGLHLFMDSLTRSGIKPFWFGPKIRGIIKTGSAMDHVLFVFLAVICLLMWFNVL